MLTTAAFEKILLQVAGYYTERIKAHGATAKGVDWKSTESQELRFRQLLKLCEGDQKFSIIDYGCGYGQLVAYMLSKRMNFSYVGLDISEDMVVSARRMFGHVERCEFQVGFTVDQICDYVVASGIFNVKQDTTEATWWEYMQDTLGDMYAHSGKGIAFNCLTSYADANHVRQDLYYADPCMVFDHCKRRFSREVALLHDYGLYEFTILVRKTGT